MPGWSPFVTAINMNGTSGTNFHSSDGTNGIAYIEKLAYFGSAYSPGKLIISANARWYSNAYSDNNWYFNDKPLGLFLEAYSGKEGVLSQDPTASIIYTNGPNNIGKGTNVAGYFSYGWNGGLGADTLQTGQSFSVEMPGGI